MTEDVSSSLLSGYSKQNEALQVNHAMQSAAHNSMHPITNCI